MSQRYDATKARLDAIDAEMASRAAKRSEAEAFLETCENSKGIASGFSEKMWFVLADHATVHTDGRITVTFKNGMVIKIHASNLG